MGHLNENVATCSTENSWRMFQALWVIWPLLQQYNFFMPWKAAMNVQEGQVWLCTDYTQKWIISGQSHGPVTSTEHALLGFLSLALPHPSPDYNLVSFKY